VRLNCQKLCKGLLHLSDLRWRDVPAAICKILGQVWKVLNPNPTQGLRHLHLLFVGYLLHHSSNTILVVVRNLGCEVHNDGIAVAAGLYAACSDAFLD